MSIAILSGESWSSSSTAIWCAGNGQGFTVQKFEEEMDEPSKSDMPILAFLLYRLSKDRWEITLGDLSIDTKNDAYSGRLK